MACQDPADSTRSPYNGSETSSPEKLVKSISRLLESGASEDEISDLMNALSSYSDVSEARQESSPPAHPGYSSSKLLDPFQSVGSSWHEWDLAETDEDEEKFINSFPLKLATRLKTAQAAYGDLGSQFQTLGQLCDTDALIEAGLRIGKAWGAYSEALGELAQALEEDPDFGEELKENAEAIQSAWFAVEESLAEESSRLGEDFAANLEALSVQLRLLRMPLQSFTNHLKGPFEEAPAFLVTSALAYGRANLALVESMSLIIIASVGPPASSLVTCSPRCPHVDCTNWCSRRYSNARCTPWRRIVGGVGGPSGLYHRVCSWVVKETETSICSCYRSRWDRFLAQNACASTRIRRSAFTTGRTQEWSAILGTPPGPAVPAPYTVSSPGRC